MSATSIDRPGQMDGHFAADRGQIAEIQRRRLIEATALAVASVGARNLTVAHIVAQAGVSRRTFYETFESCEECLLAAFDDGVAQAADRIAAACAEVADKRWQERMRAGLAVLLQYMDEQPNVARLLALESLGAGVDTLARRQEVNARLVAAVDSVRAEGCVADSVPPLTAESIVGAVGAVLHNHLLESRPLALTDLLNPLMSMLVLPYLGLAAARRELERGPHRAPGNGAKPSVGGSLGKLDMRLTYRTVRVLAAVAANPGSSNRAIGLAAGIADQGQASKLLRRLQRLGLVENVPKDRLRGEPNSWTLTEKGWQVHASMRAKPSPS